MKHLKLFENWLRRTDDRELIEVADYIDDILLDISDMDFPYYEKTMISKNEIMFEISANSDNSITDDKFELTEEILTILERCHEYVESVGYQMSIYVRWDVMENATLGEQIEDEGGGIVSLQELKGYLDIGNQHLSTMHYIGVTVKKK
jgi:hypothetical protein